MWEQVRDEGDSPSSPPGSSLCSPVTTPGLYLSLKEQAGKLSEPGEKGHLFPYIR